jgi:hypothetical protein
VTKSVMTILPLCVDLMFSLICLCVTKIRCVTLGVTGISNEVMRCCCVSAMTIGMGEGKTGIVLSYLVKMKTRKLVLTSTQWGSFFH